MRNHWKISAVVEIRLARQSWSTWGRLAYGFEGQVKHLPIVFTFVLYLKAYMFPTSANLTDAKGMKNLSTVQSQHVTEDIFDILMLHSRLGATSWPQCSSWTRNSDTNHEQEASLHSSGIYLSLECEVTEYISACCCRNPIGTAILIDMGTSGVWFRRPGQMSADSLYVRFVSEGLHVSHLSKSNRRKVHEKPIDGTITTCHRGHLWHSDASF